MVETALPVRIPNILLTVFHMQIILRGAHKDLQVHHIGKQYAYRKARQFHLELPLG
jgi:hypothetical protein